MHIGSLLQALMLVYVKPCITTSVWIGDTHLPSRGRYSCVLSCSNLIMHSTQPAPIATSQRKKPQIQQLATDENYSQGQRAREETRWWRVVIGTSDAVARVRTARRCVLVASWLASAKRRGSLRVYSFHLPISSLPSFSSSTPLVGLLAWKSAAVPRLRTHPSQHYTL